jgi:hypothetical protein
MRMENHGGMLSTEKNSSFVHQSSLANIPESSNSKAGRTGKGNDEVYRMKYLFDTSKGS